MRYSSFIKRPINKRMQWIKGLFFTLCIAPIARLIWLITQDDLTANPIEFIERNTGSWALIMLLLCLSLTPIRLITGYAWPIQLRRMLGLFMFFYACLHVTVYLWIDFSFVWLDISKDVAKHPRILFGFFAFILAVPLAVTSNNKMMRALGRRWKTLHKLVYLIAILSVLHYLLLVKKDISEPMLYIFFLSFLLGIRLYYKFSTKP